MAVSSPDLKVFLVAIPFFGVHSGIVSGSNGREINEYG